MPTDPLQDAVSEVGHAAAAHQQDPAVARHRIGRGVADLDRLDDHTWPHPVIGISLELLAEAGEHLPVDESGCILLASDPRYRYRPVRFAGITAEASGPCRVLVCERVSDG